MNTIVAYQFNKGSVLFCEGFPDELIADGCRLKPIHKPETYFNIVAKWTIKPKQL